MAETQRRRRESPKIRRAQILEAAARSFRTNGLQGSTVDKIASEAGVSVGLLYRFFASKAAIVEAIVAADIERQLEQAAALLKAASQHPETLPQRISEHLAKGKIDRERFALQFEISAEACRNEQLRAFIRVKRSQLIDTLANAFPEWAAERSSTEHMLESLELAGAVASGLAIHAAIYSDSPRLPGEMLAELIRAIFAREPGSEFDRG
jgi:AcrR family transcriptional regulator